MAKILMEVDDKLKKELKQEALNRDMTLTALLLEYILRCLPRKKETNTN
jgi:hypothetical protein